MHLRYTEIQSYIAPTCFNVTPSSGSFAPRFAAYYSMIHKKSSPYYITVFLQLM